MQILATFFIALSALMLMTEALELVGLVKSFERQVLDVLMPDIISKEYKDLPHKELYNISYRTVDEQVREEVGILMNPGTGKEELVVMGSFGYEDGDIRTVTMYTADKNGYRPRVQLKNRQYKPQALRTLVGNG